MNSRYKHWINKNIRLVEGVDSLSIIPSAFQCFSINSINSPVSPPNASEEGSCWETADAVEVVDTGDDKPTSGAVVHVLGCDWSVGCVGGRTGEESVLGFEGLLPVTGLQTPELSSGHRKTSMGPRVLFSDTW